MATDCSASKAILVCGLCGAIYGAAAGAAFVACVALIFGSVVGFVLGTISGFVAGTVGGVLRSSWGWFLGGFIGGLTIGAPLILPPIIGGVVGLVINSEMHQPTSFFPLLNWMKTTINESGLARWPLWKRCVMTLALVIIFGTGLLQWIRYTDSLIGK